MNKKIIAQLLHSSVHVEGEHIKQKPLMPYLFRAPCSFDNGICGVATHDGDDQADHFTNLVKHEALTFDLHLRVLKIANEERLATLDLPNISHR